MDSVILVVDDDTSNLMLAQKLLGKEYRIAAANSGAAAFKYLENNRPDLILLDINMPEMDGFEVMERLKSEDNLASIPVIFLTADRDEDTETKCFGAGAVDFVGKPFVPDVMRSRVRKTLELAQYHTKLEMMVAEQAEIITKGTRRISEIQEQVIMGMASLIESRDNSTGRHVKNTRMYVEMIAKELRKRGLFPEVLNDDYIQNLTKAAPLHDVGKIKIADAILQKPGKLTDEEYLEMQKHTEFGGQIIKDIISGVEDKEYVKIAYEVATYHHERWDGRGYPKGLAGEDIPLCARIMEVADVFDALYSERCYKQPIRPVDKVMEIIKEGAGTQFDPVIADVFAEMAPMLKCVLGEME